MLSPASTKSPTADASASAYGATATWATSSRCFFIRDTLIRRSSYSVATNLHDFTFADETHLVDDVSGVELVDHAFECAGGEGSVAAIEQIIDRINPEGTVSLLGVSENNVPINTRMVLEKGLRLFGSSRSGREDFEATVRLYHEHPEVLDYLAALVCSVNEARQISRTSANPWARRSSAGTCRVIQARKR